ncbi:MAG: hypothetical protein WBA76_03755 [Phormidesmis sp.]
MGIFEFVFGKSAPKDDTKGKQAYYLNDDDAKSFGDIEYMRSSKTVRRTFAKKKGQEHLESVRQISFDKAGAVDSDAGLFSPLTQAAVSDSNAGSSTANPSVPKSARPRRTAKSGDMDTFRNMAKDIRK